MDKTNSVSSAGIGFGVVIAMILSNEINHSIMWMIIHGFLGWFYVLYRIL